MALLPGDLPVALKDLVDKGEEGVKRGPGSGGRAVVPGRLGMVEDLQEHSIVVGSRSSPNGDRKCLLLKMVPAFRLIIRSQQQYRFGALLVPVDTRPLQPQVHHTSDRTLDRATADRQLQLRDPCIVHPLLTRLSDLQATAASLWSRFRMHSGEGGSSSDSP